MKAADLRSLDRVFLTSLTLMVLWALLYKPVLENTEARGNLFNIQLWSSLFDIASELQFSEIVPDASGAAQLYCRLPSPVGGPYARCAPIEATVAWPTPRSYPLRLMELGGAISPQTTPRVAIYFYRFESSRFLGMPTDAYALVRIRFGAEIPNGTRQMVKVVQVAGLSDVRACLLGMSETLPNKIDDADGQLFKPFHERCFGDPTTMKLVPNEWEWIAQQLRENAPMPWLGWNAASSTANPWRGVVRQLIEKVDAPAERVGVWGVTLDSRLFIEAGTFLIALVAFWGIGSFRAVRYEREAAQVGATRISKLDSNSVLVARTRDEGAFWNYFFEGALILLTLGWSFAPIAMGLLIARLDAWFGLLAVVAVSLGAVGSLVFLFISTEWRHLRRREER